MFNDKGPLIMGVIVFLLLLVIGQTIHAKTAEAALAKYKQEAAEATLKLEAKNRDTELALNQAADQTKKELNDQVAAVARQRDDLSRRLRDAYRAANLPSSPSIASVGTPGSGSDGTLIPGTIGQEDVDEAARADTIRAHYLSCVEQYEKAREMLSH